MIAKAIARFIRISPRKARLVADMVRGKPIGEAQAILMNLQARPRFYVQEVLKSAIANATVKEPDVSLSNLYISKITVDGGPMFKRYRAGSMGRAMMVRHRTSHILIELDKKQEVIKGQQSTVNSPQKKTKRPSTIDHRQLTREKAKSKDKKLATAKKGK